MLYVFLVVLLAAGAAAQTIPAPQIWTDKDLAGWANPVATLNVPPAHFSEHEYYSAKPGEWVRTYPVYFAKAKSGPGT